MDAQNEFGIKGSLLSSNGITSGIHHTKYRL